VRAIVEGILSGANVPAVFALEGGYDLKALADSALLTLRILQNA
jgi:acetoin utilization deacetylase AcuC-like enzyme